MILAWASPFKNNNRVAYSYNRLFKSFLYAVPPQYMLQFYKYMLYHYHLKEKQQFSLNILHVPVHKRNTYNFLK